MCGIAGIITPNARNYQNVIVDMTNAIAHRGPDSAHHEFYENAALGHRRLSIVDLSPTGLQPMHSDTRNECIVLNGEIYGYLEIKKNYSDYPFKGTSDTELVLAMYQRKGKDFIKDLPGMFAFGIWDEARQEMFCARDRFGEKPFYYAIGIQGEFIFASEIKAILESQLIQPIINKQALSHYLQYGYVSAHQCIYENIHTLPPAHTLTYANGKISVDRYYKIPEKDQIISASEAKEQFRYLLQNAISKQLIADVEVGSFLSGGLDSSTIVSMVNQFLPHQTTISYGYDSEHSELKFAKEVAKKYHTHHIEIFEKRGNIAEDLLKIAPYFDEPFADMSFVPQYKICEAAAQHLKVVLAGDVGDELFGGYHFYTVENEMRNHFSYANWIAKAALKGYSKFRKTSFVAQKNIEFNTILDFHQQSIRNFLSQKDINILGINEIYHQPYSFQADPNSLNDIMRTDLEKYVPGNMLVKSDRMAMANSLEVRTPFLDKDFAEFCIQLPENLKISSENDKIILRESMQNYWTESIRKRRKQGFGSSVEHWLKEKNMVELSNDLLRDKNANVFQYIDFKSTQNLLHKDKKHWNLLQLAIWASYSKPT